MLTAYINNQLLYLNISRCHLRNVKFLQCQNPAYTCRDKEWVSLLGLETGIPSMFTKNKKHAAVCIRRPHAMNGMVCMSVLVQETCSLNTGTTRRLPTSQQLFLSKLACHCKTWHMMLHYST